jgi:hypothetical protein
MCFTAMAGKTNKLTIYLIKPDLTEFGDLVKPDTTAIDIPEVGTFYMENSHPRKPDWVADFFKATLDNKIHLITSSAKGLLLIRVPDGDRRQIFAVAFGHGRHLLMDGVVEERFGLKVVLNSVVRDSLAPFIGTLVAIVLLHDPLSVRLVLSGALMGFGLWMHLAERHEHEHEHDALEHEHSHTHDEHHQHKHDGPVTERHSHWHRHEPMIHTHPHYPDLHHRHGHSTS